MANHIRADRICQGRYDTIWKMKDLGPLFRALADETRLRLLNLIADREICVCYFAYLRNAGIVSARRDGKWMHYKLIPPPDEAAAGILQETLKHLRKKPEMKRDISRLTIACCNPRKFELVGAPQPASVRRQRDYKAQACPASLHFSQKIVQQL
jgi:ArsR family transcriptional regulator